MIRLIANGPEPVAQQELGSKQLFAVLDCLQSALVLTDHTRRVIYANAAAWTLLVKGDGLWADGGLLVAATSRSTRTLHERIQRAATMQCKQEAAAEDLMAFRRVSARPLWLAVLAVGCSQLGDAPRGGLVLLALHDPDRCPYLRPKAVQALYGLTSAEARVACALATGETIASYAESHNLKSATVRQHAKRALSKTGTAKQSELVALLLTGPLAVTFNS